MKDMLGKKGKGKNRNSKKLAGRKNKVVMGVVLLACLVLILISIRIYFPSSAPDFKLETARNGSVRLSELKGANTVLVFFRSTR